jgi:hypothetical protein
VRFRALDRFFAAAFFRAFASDFAVAPFTAAAGFGGPITGSSTFEG